MKGGKGVLRREGIDICGELSTLGAHLNRACLAVLDVLDKFLLISRLNEVDTLLLGIIQVPLLRGEGHATKLVLQRDDLMVKKAPMDRWMLYFILG